MAVRVIREDGQFRTELEALFPNDPKEADDLLRDAMAWLAVAAEKGALIGGTDLWFKIVPDVKKRGRFLVLFYTIDNGTVTLWSAKSFYA